MMGFPGMTAKKSTAEGAFLLTPLELAPIISVVFASTALDAGNTAKTTTLRPGLLVAEIVADKEFAEYDPAQTDGRELSIGFLQEAVDLTAETGSAADTPGKVVMGGIIDPAKVFGLDAHARAILRDRFVFSDEWNGPFGFHHRPTVPKTANYVVVAADRGKLFTTRGAAGAIQFTLPALSAVGRNFHVGFLSEAAQNMTVIRAGADTIVAFNNLAATSLAFSTAGNLIGARLEIRVNDNKTKYLAEHMGPHTLTVT